MHHAVFGGIWRPHCTKGRVEACGCRKRGGETRDVSTVGLDHTHTRSEQGKEEEKGMPHVVVENKTKIVMA